MQYNSKIKCKFSASALPVARSTESKSKGIVTGWINCVIK